MSEWAKLMQNNFFYYRSWRGAELSYRRQTGFGWTLRGMVAI